MRGLPLKCNRAEDFGGLSPGWSTPSAVLLRYAEMPAHATVFVAGIGLDAAFLTLRSVRVSRLDAL